MAAAPRSTESRSVCVIVNPAAGGGRGDGAAEGLRELFAKHGARIDVAMARASDDVKAIARRAVERGDALLVVAGGDGTLAAAASVLSGTPTALGIIPIGTFNHFAKDVGIPMDPSAAAQAALGGGRRAVDVGEVNGQMFINNSSVGLYPRLVWERQRRQEQGRRKISALAGAAFTVWRRYRRVTVRLRLLDGGTRTLTVRTPFVFVGNNVYQLSGLAFGSRARLDRGRLHICMAPELSASGMVGVLGNALVGRLASFEQFDSREVTTVTIEAWRPRLGVALDGEVAVLRTPLRYRIRPGALRVAVPAVHE